MPDDINRLYTEAIGRSGLLPEHDGFRKSGFFWIVPRVSEFPAVEALGNPRVNGPIRAPGSQSVKGPCRAALAARVPRCRGNTEHEMSGG